MIPRFRFIISSFVNVCSVLLIVNYTEIVTVETKHIGLRHNIDCYLWFFGEEQENWSNFQPPTF